MIDHQASVAVAAPWNTGDNSQAEIVRSVVMLLACGAVSGRGRVFGPDVNRQVANIPNPESRNTAVLRRRCGRWEIRAD